MIESDEWMKVGDWLMKAVFNYGFPTVVLLILLFGGWKGIRAVWSKLCDWIESGLETFRDFLAGVSENDTKRTEAIQTLTMSGMDGHAKTHGKLDDVHADVKHIKERFQQ